MRLASFSVGGRAAYGQVRGDQVLDLTSLTGWPYSDLRSLLPHLTAELRRQIDGFDGPTIAAEEVQWAPVIPNPSKIICVGLNYQEHAHETGRANPHHPVLFLRCMASQVGHSGPLVRPSVSVQLDFEGELAVVIGRDARHVRAERALDCVAGYSIYNDASVRDWQQHSHQYTAGKNFQGTGAFGPYLVTADEIPSPRVLELTTRLNGNVMQRASVADMIFPIEHLLAYISTFTVLQAGDVLVTGTPAGVGATRTPPVWLVPGDTVEVEVCRIGVLRNHIVQEADS